MEQAGREGIMGTMRELQEHRRQFMPMGAEEAACSRQSIHSSEETSNDRGAKGCREVKA